MGTDGACGLLFCAAKGSGAFPPNIPAGLRNTKFLPKLVCFDFPELRVCLVHGYTRTQANGYSLIHPETLSNIPRKGPTLKIFQKAAASHGASLQVFQNE
jgi:hypothetical protein